MTGDRCSYIKFCWRPVRWLLGDRGYCERHFHMTRACECHPMGTPSQ